MFSKASIVTFTTYESGASSFNEQAFNKFAIQLIVDFRKYLKDSNSIMVQSGDFSDVIRKIGSIVVYNNKK